MKSPQGSHANPEYDGLLTQGQESIDRGQLEVARLVLNRAVALEPGRPEAFNLLGVALEKEGQYLEALRFYRAAIALDGTFRQAWDNVDRIVRRPLGNPGRRDDP